MENIAFGKNEKISLLHKRMEHFSKMLDDIDPEKAGVEEIDQIIAMLDEIEEKCKDFR